MIFRVKFKIDGNEKSAIEPECGWFLIDQQGKFYSYGPCSPVKPVESCIKEIEPLILINNEYLTIEEIEERINKF